MIKLTSQKLHIRASFRGFLEIFLGTLLQTIRGFLQFLFSLPSLFYFLVLINPILVFLPLWYREKKCLHIVRFNNLFFSFFVTHCAGFFFRFSKNNVLFFSFIWAFLFLFLAFNKFKKLSHVLLLNNKIATLVCQNDIIYLSWFWPISFIEFKDRLLYIYIYFLFIR